MIINLNRIKIIWYFNSKRGFYWKIREQIIDLEKNLYLEYILIYQKIINFKYFKYYSLDFYTRYNKSSI